MKKSIKNQLFKGIFIFLFINILIIIIVFYLIKKEFRTSDKLVSEFYELDATNEISKIPHDLYYVFDIFSDSSFNKERLYNEIELNISKFNKYYAVISEYHSKSLLRNFIDSLRNINKLIITDQTGTYNPAANVRAKLNCLITSSNAVFNKLKQETKKEVIEHLIEYRRVFVNTFIIIFILLLILFISMILLGLFIQKRIVGEINMLNNFTKALISGNRAVRVENISSNEFHELAGSFNELVENLNHTTVTRNYYDSIIQSIFDMLIVVNKDKIIESANKATHEVLLYNKNELSGISIENIIANEGKESGMDLFNDEVTLITGKEYHFIRKDKALVPVLISCSVLRNYKGENSGRVIVAHDISEKRAVESRLEIERKERAIALNEAHEEERLRIAKDLHDGLGQILTGIYYSIENNLKDILPEDETFQKKLMRLQEQIDLALSETKNISHDLIPIILKDFGLVVAVKNLINQVKSNSTINFNLLEYNYKRVEPKLEKALYRIIQEGVNNIIKYSNAGEANIQIIMHDDSISLVIEDNGVGFDVQTMSKGTGLLSMKERVSAFNGSFNISSEINSGTEIIIDIPI